MFLDLNIALILYDSFFLYIYATSTGVCAKYDIYDEFQPYYQGARSGSMQIFLRIQDHHTPYIHSPPMFTYAQNYLVCTS